MKKRYIVGVVVLCVMLFFVGCSSKVDEKEGSKLDALYIVDYFTGYRFFDDGTVIYYEANWYKKKDEKTGCKPEYWYGTYTLDEPSLTIVLSGVDTPITGVYTDNNVVINGNVCELKDTPYYDGEEHHPSWKELDKVLGLYK